VIDWLSIGDRSAVCSPAAMTATVFGRAGVALGAVLGFVISWVAETRRPRHEADVRTLAAA
jgi:hypothetical protein